MNRKLLAIVIATTMLLSINAFAGEALQTTQGTMQLGGTGTFSIDMHMPEEGDSTTGFILGLNPSFGYFIIDNLELQGMVGFATGFGDLYDGSSMNLGFGAAAKYFMGLGAMNLYFGLGVGMGFTIPDEGDTRKTLGLMLPVGILWPLNSHVALDLGLQVGFDIGLDDQGNMMRLPIGYMGVQAFF